MRTQRLSSCPLAHGKLCCVLLLNLSRHASVNTSCAARFFGLYSFHRSSAVRYAGSAAHASLSAAAPLLTSAVIRCVADLVARSGILCTSVGPEKKTIEWTTYHPKRAYLLRYIHNHLAQRARYVQMNAAAIIDQGIGVYATRQIKPATTTPWATTTRGVRSHAYEPTAPCRLPRPDDRDTVNCADPSRTMGLTPAAGGVALELRPDTTGRVRLYYL